jgi:NADH dehydrogenase [ubiquinone] 1 alpha subcomplex assembly factor 7
MVDVKDSVFHPVLAPHETLISKHLSDPVRSARYESLPQGCRIEVSTETQRALQDLLLLDNISALIIDYGSTEIPSNTLRGIRKHAIVSPFSSPGETDVSADVDFTDLSVLASARGCNVHGPIEQGSWLYNAGMDIRRDVLMQRSQNPERIEQEYNRLTGRGDGQMGHIYKVMAITQHGNIPLGFETRP